MFPLTLVFKYVPTHSGFRVTPQWMNTSVLGATRKKCKAWHKFQATSCALDYNNYCRCRNVSTLAVRKAKCDFEQDIANNVANNPKRFRRYVQSKSKVKQSVSSIQRLDGTITTSDMEIANVLNSFFGSVFTNEHLTEVPSLPDKFIGPPLSSLEVPIEMVWEKLCKLNPSKSGGPDKCHPLVFREVEEGLLQPLFTISEISDHGRMLQ